MGTRNEKAKQGFGRRIRDAREAAGLSQTALLERIGWPSNSNSRLSSYELETRQPSLDDFEAIARACGVDPVWLVFARGSRKRGVAA